MNNFKNILESIITKKLSFPNDKDYVTEANGFKKTKALDITRFFMYGKDYIAKYGKSIKSLENTNQTVTEDSIVMFDDISKLIGYPANQKAFSKYEIITDSKNGIVGKAVKRDTTEYLSKQMDQEFSAVIWNGDVLNGNVGDFLVANVPNNDFRIVDKNIFKKSYKQVS
jgi:hypothetical protein